MRLDRDENARELAQHLPEELLKGATPRLIDEWQVAPDLWDAVRHLIDDRSPEKGQFILTGSSVPADDANRHSGAGRIATLDMRPMTLFETGDSNGVVQLETLFSGEQTQGVGQDLGLKEIFECIVRGGWPANLGLDSEEASLAVEGYINQIVHVDISRLQGSREKNPIKVERLLRSLARNVGTEVSMSTLVADTGNEGRSLDRGTVSEYLKALSRLRMIENLPAWRVHLRSKAALRQAPKRFFVDPSIATGIQGIGAKRLLDDLKYAGFLFESLVIRDLRVYAQCLRGQVFYYRDSNNREVDAIVELRDGRWLAVEVKLGGQEHIEAAATNLKRCVETVDTDKAGKPAALVVVTATGPAYQRGDGVIVTPITALTP